MSATTYVTTRPRRIASIFLGALLGSLITAFPIALISSEGRIVDSPTDLLFSFALCGVIWLVGIAAFAFPIWLLIERRRKSLGWRNAAVCGLGLSPAWFVLVMLMLAGLFQEDYGLDFWLGPMIFAVAIGAIICSVVGSAVALVMWRFAYRRVAVADIAETFS